MTAMYRPDPALSLELARAREASLTPLTAAAQAAARSAAAVAAAEVARRRRVHEAAAAAEEAATNIELMNDLAKYTAIMNIAERLFREAKQGFADLRQRGDGAG